MIGADGLHSNVRRLAFGDRPEFRFDVGLYVSIFGVTAGPVPTRTATAIKIPDYPGSRATPVMYID